MTPAARHNADVVLAFDYGLRRIGVATGNLRTRTASPLTTIERGDETPWNGLDMIVRDWQPGRLIVGVPEGSPGVESIAPAAREFADALRRRYSLPVETVDEALTSAAASAELSERRRAGELRRRVRKTSVDSHAACLIAEQWLHETRTEAS